MIKTISECNLLRVQIKDAGLAVTSQQIDVQKYKFFDEPGWLINV